MNVFEEAATNRQPITITSENLPQYKEWLNNPNNHAGYYNFSVADDVPFTDIIPNNQNDDEKIGVAAYIIEHTLSNNENRIKECIDLASTAPKIPVAVWDIAGRGYGSLYDKLCDAIKNRSMSDNLTMVANNTYYLPEHHLMGKEENIISLPPEKKRALNDILNTYDNWKNDTRYSKDNGTNTKIQFIQQLYKRGDLLNYNGLNTEQRKEAIQTYINTHNREENIVEKTLACLDDKYLTVDILKATIMREKEVYNGHQYVKQKTLNVYNDVAFDVSKSEKRRGVTSTYHPSSSDEYAKKDTSKAKTQTAKNVNILSEDYKRIRDVLIKESTRRNSNSANAGFKEVCCELFDVKSFDEIPEGSLTGLLADINLKTAQHDISNGKTQNLSAGALQMVLDTDRDGYYTRKITPQDIDVVNRYSYKNKQVSLFAEAQGILYRNEVISPENLRKLNQNDISVRGFTPKEKRAMLARSKVAFIATQTNFRLGNAAAEQSRQFAILASDAVQQKKDFTPEQKAEFKKITGLDYSAQEVLINLDMQFKNRKEWLKQNIDTYKKVEAVKAEAAKEDKSKTTVADKIKNLQDAYQKIQEHSKNKSFAAKDEEPYKLDNVERIISAHIERCLSSGKPETASGLPDIEKPSLMASMLAPRKESERQSLNSAIQRFNDTLTALTKDSNWDELKQYDGKMLSPEAHSQSQQKADTAKQTNQAIDKLFQDFHYQRGFDKQQSQIAEQIYAASPVPVEKLELNSSIKDSYGNSLQETLGRIEKGEQAFTESANILSANLQNKKQAQEKALAQEATAQERQKSEETRARTYAAQKRLQTAGGNNMLLEEINAGIKAKEQKRANESKTFDKLAIKEALKKQQAEK